MCQRLDLVFFSLDAQQIQQMAHEFHMKQIRFVIDVSLCKGIFFLISIEIDSTELFFLDWRRIVNLHGTFTVISTPTDVRTLIFLYFTVQIINKLCFTHRQRSNF